MNDTGHAEDAASVGQDATPVPADGGPPADAGLSIDGGPTPLNLPEPHPGLIEAASWGTIVIPSGGRVGECLSVLDGGAGLAPCDEATVWRWTNTDRRLAVNAAQCLTADLTVDTCDSSPQWVLDAALRWTTRLGPGESLRCLTDRLQVDTCGSASAQIWGAEPASDDVPVDDLLGDAAGMAFTPDGPFEPLLVFGSQARVLATTGETNSVAAGTVGPGRVVAVGGFLAMGSERGDDRWEDFLTRVLEWLTRGSSTAAVVYWPRERRLVRFLGFAGATIEDLNERNLLAADILVIAEHTDPVRIESDAAVVKAFLRRGGSVLLMMRNWLYWQISENPPDTTLAARVAGWAGIAMNDATDRAGSNPGPRLATPSESRQRTATAMVEAAARHALGIQEQFDPVLRQMANRMSFNVGRTRMHETGRLALATRALERALGPVEIGPGRDHVWGDDPLADLQLQAEYIVVNSLPADEAGVHPSARLYPGLVPDRAPRVVRERRLEFVGNRTPWFSTGLYAPPGEKIRVRVPQRAIGQGLNVRIGSWNDTPMPHVGWANPPRVGRFPHISAGRRINAERMEFGSAFGGLVFVELSREPEITVANFVFEGVVEAPRFELGQSTNADWQAQLASRPAPMGEIITEAIHIDAETRVLSTVRDAEALARLWHDSVLAHGDLVGQPPGLRPEKYPQRFTFDPWQSRGAHSGFPIHITQDWTEEVLDLDALRAGRGEHWAPLQELGHNFQEDSWTFSTWFEVTSSIHVAHACETVFGLDKTACGTGTDPTARAVARNRYFASNVPFNADNHQILEAGLDMFLLLEENGGGWPMMKRVFRRYRDLPSSEIPQTDQEKVDTMARIFSQEVGADLGPFFVQYKLPVSAAVRAELAELPLWVNNPLTP